MSAGMARGRIASRCSCGRPAGPDGLCAECRRRRAGGDPRREPEPDRGVAPPAVEEVVHSAGRPLDAAVRARAEGRFGHDLRRVAVHADPRAGESARQVGAVAYTVGRHVVLDAARVGPQTPAGQRVLAHELTHVVQQGAAEPGAAPIPLAPEAAGTEREAERTAGAATAARPQLRAAAPQLMRLTPTQFRNQLGSTPEQKLAIDHLFLDPTFSALFAHLASCAATPVQDLGPLALKVTPGFTIGGIVRFGGYSSVSRTLEINPTKPEHVSNPAELVDTVVHELIHAASDLDAPCQAAGSAAAPLAGAATVPRISRASVSAGAHAALNVALGPSASDPCGEFMDINDAAQQIVGSVLQSGISTTRVGRPTLTFVNLIIRNDPAALAAYETCRTAACALAGAARTTALTDCATQTIGEFLPAGLQASLFPAHILFDFGSSAVRADMRQTLEMIAAFLLARPALSVELEGHTDPVGSPSSNVTLGQARADAVETALLALGVPASQIGLVFSVGEAGRISTTSAEHFRDRRVVVTI